MKRKRLDEILMEKGWAKDKKDAFVMVTEGRVLVWGQKAVSPAQMVSTDAQIEVRGERKYVGRGAYKLEAALEKFGVKIKDKVCADIGAATGGFTEVLLLHGAARVYAIDTAKGKLAPKLRESPQVVVMEETDVRALQTLPEAIDCATIDVSLIPLENIMPRVRRFLTSKGAVLALFKPQYQTRDPKALKHGIVRDPKVRKHLLDSFRQWAGEHGWEILETMESPIRGGEGNIEYLVWLRLS